MREKGQKDMKHLWEKVSHKIRVNEYKRILYVCDDFPGVCVCSNTEYKPHANDSGRWAYHSFFVETSDRFKKEFRTLKEAKAFVENGGLNDENRS